MTMEQVVQYIETFKVPDEEDNGDSLDDSASYFSDYYDNLFDYWANYTYNSSSYYSGYSSFNWSSYYTTTYDYYGDDESSTSYWGDSGCEEIWDDFSYWLSYIMEDSESSSSSFNS